MPILHEVSGGTKTKIYCQGTICHRCILAALRTVKLGLNKVGHQAKPLKYSEKKVIFHTNLEQMLNVQPRHSSQWRSRDWHVHSVHVNSVSYLLWHTWRVICLEGWTQNLTRVCIAVKLTSTWAELLNIHEAYGAVYGTGREAYKIYQEQFPKSVCQDYIKFDSVNHCLG